MFDDLLWKWCTDPWEQLKLRMRVNVCCVVQFKRSLADGRKSILQLVEEMDVSESYGETELLENSIIGTRLDMEMHV